ncbi:VOC family protein [Roseiterribacter gracilis]|uniref:Lactoylglutathione lyase n=1 Tax=Roseiterribacter gracilis TaxID=2812848 RepID=A0A8S8XDZ5_9PROT|nr:lactoylglutathione lyase [Rhodospirillales bacterium TMPK1]
MIRFVKFVNLPVRDQQRALEFYRNVMGFSVETDAAYGDSRWIEIGIPQSDTRLVFTKRDDDTVPQAPTVVFFSDDVRGDHDRLVARGATSKAPPTETPWEKGKSYAWLLDSENNLLMLSDS